MIDFAFHNKIYTKMH